MTKTYMVFCFICLCSIGLFAYSGGDGTQSSPYVIATLADLQQLSTSSQDWGVDKYFFQISDIDASDTRNWNVGDHDYNPSTPPEPRGFSPLGLYVYGQSLTASFRATYYGNGHTISNLYINRSSYSYLGFISYAEDAFIYNLGLVNVDINCVNRQGGYAWGVGALAGKSIRTLISGCYSTGSVAGTGPVMGGLAGASHSSIIRECYSAADVFGSSYVGGLAGDIDYSTAISNCYSVGNVSGTSQVGGLVGQSASSVVTNSFWNTESSGQSQSAGGTGKTTAEMRTLDTYLAAGWDFIDEAANDWTGYWRIREYAYPHLNWQFVANFSATPTTVNLGTPIQFTSLSTFTALQFGWDFDNNGTTDSTLENPSWTYSVAGTYTVSHTAVYGVATDTYSRPGYITVINPLTGSGTAGNPYQIGTLAELLYLSNTPELWQSGLHFLQTADIDALATQGLNGGQGFSPIGRYAPTELPFRGNYNGNGKVISNLFINRPGTSYVGLFGYTSSAVITNLGVVDTHISGSHFVGGLVGDNDYSSTLSNCFSTGEVFASWHGGGLVGYNSHSSSINNCYSLVSVTVYAEVAGGLVGFNGEGGGIANSYSAGGVTGSASSGGLVGGAISTAVTSSFWNVDTSGLSTSAAGTGIGSIQMRHLPFFLGAGWDFAGETANGASDLWGINPAVNNGFPFLTSQGYAHAPYTLSYDSPQPVITRSETTRRLDWEAVEGASFYKVYASLNPAAEFPTQWQPASSRVDVNYWVDVEPAPSARFFKVTACYEVTAPIIEPTGGRFFSPREVLITCSDTGSVIYYTTDGSAPTMNSSQYLAPLTLSSEFGENSTIVKAKAFSAGGLESNLSSAVFTIIGRVYSPLMIPEAGVYCAPQTVYLSCPTPGAAIYYTTDGSEPSSASTPYISPIDVGQNTTIKAIAYYQDWPESHIASGDYYVLTTPTFSHASGIYTTQLQVSLNCTTENASIYYTTDGSYPTTASAVYSLPIPIEKHTLLKAVSCINGVYSPLVEAEYFIRIPFVEITVEGGSFHNGTSTITLSDFYLCSTEVTQASYISVMEANPSTGNGVGAEYPVINVSWGNAVAYCNRLSILEGLTPCYSYNDGIEYGTDPVNWPVGWEQVSWFHIFITANWAADGYRLPTEMEWMFAARGGNLTQNYTYCGGNDIDAVSWYDTGSTLATTHPTALLTPNELGLFDMGGNAWEWCWDRYADYPIEDQTNPKGPESGSYRMLRGGSGYSPASQCNADFRNWIFPTYDDPALGFRVARSLFSQ